MSNQQTASNWKRWVIGAVVTAVAVIGVVGGAYWALADLWDSASPEKAEFLAYLIGVALLVCQIVVSGFRAAATDKTARAMQQTAESTEKGNVAERFKNAIEHLGNESSSVRLGGVYALHYLAQDEVNYRARVFEILCAHIRETTTDESYKQRPITPGEDCNAPTVEIQNILNLLFVSESGKKIYKGNRANLQGANLQRVVLENANLENAFLLDVDLQGASLANVNLKNAVFYNVQLKYAAFTGADLEGADMIWTYDLVFEQLKSVKTLYRAQIPLDLEKRIEAQTPELFEKPSDKSGRN